MARRVYTNTVSLILNKPYRVKGVPMSYSCTSTVVKDSSGEIIPPVYEPDPDERTSRRVTIMVMVDMFFNNVPFGFVSEDDAMEVCVQLMRYMEWLQQHETVPKDHVLFSIRAKDFLQFLHNRCLRMKNARKIKGIEPETFADKVFGVFK